MSSPLAQRWRFENFNFRNEKHAEEENVKSGSRKPPSDDHGYKAEGPKKIPKRSIDEYGDRLKTLREVPPTHYILKIDSFSLLVRSLAKVGLYTYISKEFEAGGYKWTLLLYPGTTEEGNGCIHLSLEIMNPPPQEIKALVIFFLYDQHKKRYLSIQDIEASQEFDENQNKQSDPYPIVSLKDFKNTSNGYLVDDKCTFGVEVFVLGSGGETSARFQTRKPCEHAYIWNLNKQSVVKETSKFSHPFTIGDYKWKLHLYRKINEKEKEKCMSISLCLQMEDQTIFPLGWKMYVEFKLSLKVKGHEISKRGNAWYSVVHTAWGFPKFINLDELGSDPVQIEVQIISMSMEKIKPKSLPFKENNI